MTNRNPLDSSTLLDCLSLGPVMVSADQQAFDDLRGTLRELGHIGGGMPQMHLDYELDVLPAAQQLIDSHLAFMDESGWLSLTNAGHAWITND